jgi:hypothetical protein
MQDLLIEFTGNWDERKAVLKQKFQILTDKDLRVYDGKYDEMSRRLQLILGKTNEEMYKLITG